MLMNNMNQLEDSSYSGKFVGTVVFNQDPLKKQRIKVSIPNLLEAPVDQLPWFAPVLASGFGNEATSNVMQVPIVGSKVVVEFQNEDIHYGLYVGYVDSKEIHDDPELLVNYPKRRGWRDPAGNKLIIDHTGGQETVEFRHKSGTKFFIYPNGNLLVHVEGNSVMETTGNMNFQAGGNLVLQANGSVQVQSGGSMNLQASGNLGLQTGGSLTGSSSGPLALNAGGSASINSPSVISLNAPRVNV